MPTLRSQRADLPVDRLGADDRLVDLPLGRVQDERLRLGAAEPAVGADQLLERGDLVGGRVEQADRDEVGAVLHPVDAPQTASTEWPP